MALFRLPCVLPAIGTILYEVVKKGIPPLILPKLSKKSQNSAVQLWRDLAEIGMDELTAFHLGLAPCRMSFEAKHRNNLTKLSRQVDTGH
jgi:hypothetical protein